MLTGSGRGAQSCFCYEDSLGCEICDHFQHVGLSALVSGKEPKGP